AALVPHQRPRKGRDRRLSVPGVVPAHARDRLRPRHALRCGPRYPGPRGGRGVPAQVQGPLDPAGPADGVRKIHHRGTTEDTKAHKGKTERTISFFALALW